ERGPTRDQFQPGGWHHGGDLAAHRCKPPAGAAPAGGLTQGRQSAAPSPPSARARAYHSSAAFCTSIMRLLMSVSRKAKSGASVRCASKSRKAPDHSSTLNGLRRQMLMACTMDE